MSSGNAPNIASRTILVVANETLGGQSLLDAVRERADSDTRFILCVPQNKPRAGLVVYNEAVFDAAQVRLDLALEVIRDMDIRAIEKAVAYLDAVSFESLPILATGSCVMAGVSTQVPVIVQVAEIPEAYAPNNRTMSLVDTWRGSSASTDAA